MADNNNLVWVSSPYKTEEAWSLSCLVPEHVLMVARQPQANTAGAVKEMTKTPEPMNNEEADEVLNVEYLSVSSRGSHVTTEDIIDPATTPRSKRKRKRGNPWSENEHSQFLQGLLVHGKGKWKKISRDFVKTRNPVQVASHAQKFFDRHNSSKPKKRKSINDIISLPATETLIQPHVHTHPPTYSSTYDLPPLPDIFYETPYIFGNHLVDAATDLVSAPLTNQENKMQLSYHASYPPSVSHLMWDVQANVNVAPLTDPNVQANVNVAPLTDQDLMVPQFRDGCSMMEPQFHPYQTPFPIFNPYQTPFPITNPYQSPFPIINPEVDNLSVPKLIDGDYSMSIDMSILPPPL